MASSVRAPAKSSSAISRSASTRLGFAIQDNALVKRVSKYAARVEISLFPGIERAWDDVAMKSAPRYGLVDLVVVQQSVADDEEVVIALSPIGTTRAAAEEDDRARMETFHEAIHRLGKSGIFDRSLLHTGLYTGRESPNPIRLIAR